MTFTTTWRRPWPLPDPELPGPVPTAKKTTGPGPPIDKRRACEEDPAKLTEKHCARCDETKAITEFAGANPNIVYCKPCDAAYKREWRQAHPGAGRRADRARKARAKASVFAHYGTACACCGSTELLQIDHVAGGGRADRAAGRRGSALYRWLVSQGFPPGFQTLCRPCNRSKGTALRCKLYHVADEAA